jgi:hypothetical protein
MISHELAMSLWYRAAEAKIGIAIPTSDIVYLMQTLYTARQSADDSSLARLSLLKATGEVWIVDREAAENVQRLKKGDT